MGEYLFWASGVISLVNGYMLFSVNPGRNVNRVFLLTSVTIALWASGSAMAIRVGGRPELNQASLIFWLRFSAVQGAYLGWLAWLMRNALLHPEGSLTEVVRRSWLFFWISSFAALIASTDWYIPSDSTPYDRKRGLGFPLYIAIAAAGCLWMLGDTLRLLRSVTGIQRIQMQFFVLSVLCACLLLIVSNLVGDIPRLAWLKQISPIWFLGLHITTVWCVCYYRVFDAKQIVLSSTYCLVTLAMLASLATAVSLSLGTWIPLGWAIFISVTLSLVLLASIERPVRRMIGMDLSIALNAPRREIIEYARRESDEETLRGYFEKFLSSWSRSRRATLLTANERVFGQEPLSIPLEWPGLEPVLEEGWITPETLERTRDSIGSLECLRFMRSNQLSAILSVPKGSSNPSLIVTLSTRESERPYTYPEILGILELSELMDNILTHSRVAAHAAHIARMESAALMSKGLAHDLNNLATPVATFLLYMEGRVLPGTPEAEVLDHAKHAVDVMQEYIRESLFFARTFIPSIESISAKEILHTTIRLAKSRAATRDVRLKVIDFPDFSFSGDPALIGRMLQNLTFNAIDASDSRETVELTAYPSNNETYCLEICDHGPGVPESIAHQIFEPYFTTKDTGSTIRGLGLGLAISKKIADLHQGVIHVHRRDGLKTVFVAKLKDFNVPERQKISALGKSAQGRSV